MTRSLFSAAGAARAWLPTGGAPAFWALTGLVLALPGALGDARAADETAEQKAAKQKAIAAVRGFGGQVLEIAQNDPRLEVAYHLSDKPVEDAALAPLKELPGLIHLNLRGTKITDAGLEHVKAAPELVRLHLEKTAVSDAGLASLAGLARLEYLNLYGTAVSDAGLKHLAGLKALKRLYLWDTKVTDAGVAELQKALPDVKIVRGVSLPAPEEKKPEEKK